MKLEENREIWIQRVKEFKTSNLSQVTWCRENEINTGALRYWIKKLDSSNIPTNESSPIFEFASVSLAGSNTSSSIEIEINNIKLSITNNYDEVLLLELIRSLKKL